MTRTKRGALTETVKKIVAASQAWRCSGCDVLLDSAFQVDHTVPLWAGGADDRGNATAMCATCHAKKTQSEAIERRERDRRKTIKISKAFEARVEKEERDRRVERKEIDGTVTCIDRGGRYYSVFPNACRVVMKRTNQRMGKKKNEGGNNARNKKQARSVFGILFHSQIAIRATSQFYLRKMPGIKKN